MLRLLTCGLVVLALLAGLVVTAEAAKGKKGKGKSMHGTVKSLSEDGTLTVTIKKKKVAEEVTIKLDKDVMVLDEKGQPLDSQDQKEKLKEGTRIKFTKNADNKVATVRIDGGKKKKKKNNQ